MYTSKHYPYYEQHQPERFDLSQVHPFPQYHQQPWTEAYMPQHPYAQQQMPFGPQQIPYLNNDILHLLSVVQWTTLSSQSLGRNLRSA